MAWTNSLLFTFIWPKGCKNVRKNHLFSDIDINWGHVPEL